MNVSVKKAYDLLKQWKGDRYAFESVCWIRSVHHRRVWQEGLVGV